MSIFNAKKVSLWLFFFLILFLGFGFNKFKSAGDYWFYSHQRDSEALVIGRLISKKDSSLLPDGGFLRRLNEPNPIETTYQYYYENRSVAPSQQFSVYTGQFGLQGYVFAAADALMRAMGLEGGRRFRILQTAVAATLAATLACLLSYFRREFGFVGALSALVILTFSPWLTVFARNLYWVPFTWFVPIALTWHFYVANLPVVGRRLYLASLCIAVAILVKCLCGFEYVTAIVGAAGSVAIYGLMKFRVELRAILIHSVSLGSALVSAILAAILIQFLAVACLRGSYRAAWSDFAFRIGKRTHGNPDAFGNVYTESLRSSVSDVLWIYWEGAPVFRIGSLVSANAQQIVGPIGLLILLGGLVLLLYRWRDGASRAQVLALFALAGGGGISSITWFVVGKGHSYIHTHMNYVLWHLPFLLLAAPICISMFWQFVPRPAIQSR